METRIRRNIIILAVVTFLVLIGMSAGWFFVLVRPQQEEIAKVQVEYDALKTKAAGLQAALEKERQAKDKLEYLKGQLFFFRGSDENRGVNGLYRRLYIGDIEGTNPLNQRDRQEAWRAWMNEYHYAYGPELGRELLRAAADYPSGQAPVLLTLPTIKVDDPPQRPEDVRAPANGLLKPLSATNNGELELVVTGTFQNILRFLERLNRSPFLMVVGNIKFEGYAPNLKATFKVTPYLVAAGKGVKLTATGGGATAAGAGAAGGPGGPPGAPGAPGAPGDAGAPGPPVDPAPPAAGSEGATIRIKNPRLSRQPAG